LDWVQAQLDRDLTLRQEVEALVDEISIEQDLIALREARGLSQRQLAKVAGVAQPMIARIESGKVSNFELKTLVRLAAALGARVEITLQTAKVRTRPRLAVLGRATAAKRVAAGAR
jgi:transcriptional regulator with XRE-family HTH domain